MNYEKMYQKLFNSITDAIKEIKQTTILTEEVARGLHILREGQKETEDIYIKSSELKQSDEKL